VQFIKSSICITNLTITDNVVVNKLF